MAKSLFNQFSQIRGSRTYDDQLPLTVSGVINIAEVAGKAKELDLYVDVSGTTVTRTSGTFEKRDLGNVILIGGSAYGITAADGTAACTVSSAPGDGSARPAALMYYENLEDDLNYIRTMLRRITGKTDWFTPPDVALSQLTFNFITLMDVFIGGGTYTANNMLYTVSSGVKDTSMVTFDPNTQMFTAANITTGGTLDVDGAADFDGTMNVEDGVVLQSSLTVGSDAVFQTNVTVSGTFQFDASGQAVDTIVTTVSVSSLDSELPTAQSVYEYVNSVAAGIDTFLELGDTISFYTANNMLYETTSGVADTNKLTYTPGTDAFRVGANSMTVTGTADFTSTLDVSGNATFDTDVRVDGTFKFDDDGQTIDDIVITISEPGADTNLATEQAIVEYVTAVSGILNNKIDAQDTFIELDDTPDVYSNTKLVYSTGSDIQYAANLSYDGSGLVVSGTLGVTQSVDFDSTLNVDNDVTFNDTLDVDGATTLNSTLDVDGATTINNTMVVSSGVELKTTLEVVGIATFDNNVVVSGTTTIYGATTINDTLHVTEGADFDTTLNVDGDTTLNTDLYVGDDVVVGGDVTVSGSFNFDTGATVNVIETTMDPAGGDDTTLLTENAIWDWVNTVSGVLQSSTAAQNFLALTDTDTITYTAGNMFYTNVGASGIADTANMNYDSTTQSILFTVNSGITDSAFTVFDESWNDAVIDYSNQGPGYVLSLSAPIISADADSVSVEGYDSARIAGGDVTINLRDNIIGLGMTGDTDNVYGITISGADLNAGFYDDAFIYLKEGVGVNQIVNDLATTGEGIDGEWDRTLPTVRALMDYVNLAGNFGDVGKFIKLGDAPHTYSGTKLVYSTDTDIQYAANLSYNGSTFVVSVPSTFTGNVTVSGTLYADGALDVDGATTLNGSLDVDGGTTLNNTLDVDGATTLNSSLDVDGTTVLHSTLTVSSGVDFDSTLNVDGATTLVGSLDVTGVTTLKSTLEVVSSAQFNNNVTVSGTFGFDTGTTVSEISTDMSPVGSDSKLLTEAAIYEWVNTVSGSLQGDVIWEVVDTPYTQIRPKGTHMGKAIYSSGDLTIGGNLTVSGTTTTINTNELTVEDKLITLNSGEVGAGITGTPLAGIEIDRGSMADYLFVFDEEADNFRVGVSGTMTPGNTYNLQAVCTREDSPIDMRVPWWDASDFIYRNTGETYISVNSGTNTLSVVADTDTKMMVAVDNVKIYGDANDYIEINSSLSPLFQIVLNGNTELDVTSSGLALDSGARVDDITTVITEPGDDMTLATEKAIVDYIDTVSGVLANQTSSQTFLALTDTNDANYVEGQALIYAADGVEGTPFINVYPLDADPTISGVTLGSMNFGNVDAAYLGLYSGNAGGSFSVVTNAFSITATAGATENVINSDVDLILRAGANDIRLEAMTENTSIVASMQNGSASMIDVLTMTYSGIKLEQGVAEVNNITSSISQPGSDRALATEQAIVEYVTATSGVLQNNIDHVTFLALDDVEVGSFAANNTLYLTSSGVQKTSEVTFNPSAHTFNVSLGGGTPVGYFSTTNQYLGGSDGTKVNLDQTGKATTILVNNNTEVTVNANGLSLLTGASVNDISTAMQPTGDDDTLLTEKAIYDWVNTVSGALAQSTSSQTFIALTDTPSGYENTKLVFSTASSIDYADNLLYDGAGLVVSGTLRVSGAVDCDSTLNVDAGADFQSTIDVDGAATLNSTLDVDGATTLNSTLDVDGATTLNSSLDVDGTSLFHSTVEVVGAATFENNVTVSGTFKFDAGGQAVDNIVTSISDPGSNSNLPTEAAVFTHVDTVSGVLQSEINALGAVTFYDVNMTYVSATQWTYGTGLTTTPELQIYVNGLKQRSHADYYTAAVVSGVLTVDFAFVTYSEDWVNATYRK